MFHSDLIGAIYYDRFGRKMTGKLCVLLMTATCENYCHIFPINVKKGKCFIVFHVKYDNPVPVI